MIGNQDQQIYLYEKVPTLPSSFAYIPHHWTSAIRTQDEAIDKQQKRRRENSAQTKVESFEENNSKIKLLLEEEQKDHQNFKITMHQMEVMSESQKMGNAFIFGQFYKNADFFNDIEQKKFNCPLEQINDDYKLCENVHPSEIRAGQLENNYFIYALAALAEKPSRIQKLITVITDYFEVRLIDKGKWNFVKVNKKVPLLQGKTALSSCSTANIWVTLLEKAWIQLHGYHEAKVGFPQQPLHDFTGAPIHLFRFKLAEEIKNLWNYLLFATEKQYCMIASREVGSELCMRRSGKVDGKVSTVLGGVNVELGERKRIVILRNVFERISGSQIITEKKEEWKEILKRCGVDAEKEQQTRGIFMMEYEVFLKYFRCLTVAEINDNNSYIYCTADDSHLVDKYFTLQVYAQGWYSLQVDKTIQPSGCGLLTRYPQIQMEVGQIFPHQKRSPIYWPGSISRKRISSRQYQLIVGVFVIKVKVKKNESDSQKQVTLAVYGDSFCDLRQAKRFQINIFEGEQQQYQYSGIFSSNESQKIEKDSYENILPKNLKFGTEIIEEEELDSSGEEIFQKTDPYRCQRKSGVESGQDEKYKSFCSSEFSVKTNEVQKETGEWKDFDISGND